MTLYLVSFRFFLKNSIHLIYTICFSPLLSPTLSRSAPVQGHHQGEAGGGGGGEGHAAGEGRGSGPGIIRIQNPPHHSHVLLWLGPWPALP